MTGEMQMFWAAKSPLGCFAIHPGWDTREQAEKDIKQMWGKDWKPVRVEIREVPHDR